MAQESREKRLSTVFSMSFSVSLLAMAVEFTFVYVGVSVKSFGGGID